MLELCEHALDEIALFVELPVAGLRIGWPALWARWDDGDRADGLNCLVKMVCVVGLVGNDVTGLQASQQRLAKEDIAAMARAEDDADRQAQCVADGVDLGA